MGKYETVIYSSRLPLFKVSVVMSVSLLVQIQVGFGADHEGLPHVAGLPHMAGACEAKGDQGRTTLGILKLCWLGAHTVLLDRLTVYQICIATPQEQMTAAKSRT